MVDIFISYKREERAAAKVIAEAAAARGFKLWWDVNLLPGRKFRDEIEQVIHDAKIVLVLWSKRSITSDWVRQEAYEAKKEKKLFPAIIDDIEPPFGFRGDHTYDLSAWDKVSQSDDIERLLDIIARMIGKPVKPAQTYNKQDIRTELERYQIETEIWRAVSNANPQHISEYQEYLRQFGDNGQFATHAKFRIARLSAGRVKRHVSAFWKWSLGAVGLIVIGVTTRYFTAYFQPPVTPPDLGDKAAETASDLNGVGSAAQKIKELIVQTSVRDLSETLSNSKTVESQFFSSKPTAFCRNSEGPTLEGSSIVIYFAESSASLSSREEKAVSDYIKLFEKCRITQILVSTHAAFGDDDSFAIDVTDARADAVKAFMVSRNVDADTVKVASFGFSEITAFERPNKTESNRAVITIHGEEKHSLQSLDASVRKHVEEARSAQSFAEMRGGQASSIVLAKGATSATLNDLKVQIWPDENSEHQAKRYQGGVWSSSKDYYGEIEWYNGDRYAGQFTQGKRGPYGVIEQRVSGPDFIKVYEGQWYNDKHHGFGVLWNPDGSVKSQGYWDKGELITPL